MASHWQLNGQSRVVILIAHYTGMRRGEILNLRWHQIDLSKGLIRLEGVDTITQKGRLVPLNATLTALSKDAMQSPVRCATGYVFHRNGHPIKSIRGAFDKARREAGLTDFHFHDLQHTAVTNMRRVGIDTLTAIKIAGRKTIAVFQRHNSFDEDDLRQAEAQHHQFITNLAQ
jgi:integrase